MEIYFCWRAQCKKGLDYTLTKIAPDGDIIWQYVYATEQSPDLLRHLEPTLEGGVRSIARVGVGEGEAPEYHIFELDSNGQVSSEVFAPAENLGIASGFIQEEDGIAIFTNTAFPNATDFTPKMVRLSENGSLLWEKKIWEMGGTPWHSAEKLIQAEDGHYIVGGWRREVLVHPDPDNLGIYRSRAYVAKLHKDTGTIIWVRYFQELEVEREKHELHDMRLTSDGGFIFCGQSTDRFPDGNQSEPPYQQGWLVKLDEFGCLVEGCQLSDNIAETEVQKEYFKAGPIPAGDILNIFQTGALQDQGTFELIDLQGKIVKTFAANVDQTTLMVPIATLSNGHYILALRSKGRLLQSMKIEIVK